MIEIIIKENIMSAIQGATTPYRSVASVGSESAAAAETKAFKEMAHPPADPQQYIKWRIANQPEMIKNGDAIPNFILTNYISEHFLNDDNSHIRFSKGTTLLFMVPALNNPNYIDQLPEYLASAQKIKDLGVQRIVFVAPNPPSLVKSWEVMHKATEDKVLCVADTYQYFTIAMGLGVDLTSFYCGLGARRSILILQPKQDPKAGKMVPTVVHRILESNSFAPVETTAQKVIQWLEANMKTTTAASASKPVTTATAAPATAASATSK